MTAPRESSMLPMPFHPLSQLAGIQRSCCCSCCSAAASCTTSAATAAAGGAAASGAGASARSAAAACCSHRVAATRCPVRLHGPLGRRAGASGRKRAGSAAGLRPCRRARRPLLQAAGATRATAAGMLGVGGCARGVGGSTCKVWCLVDCSACARLVGVVGLVQNSMHGLQAAGRD